MQSKVIVKPTYSFENQLFQTEWQQSLIFLMCYIKHKNRNKKTWKVQSYFNFFQLIIAQWDRVTAGAFCASAARVSRVETVVDTPLCALRLASINSHGNREPNLTAVGTI